MAVKITAAAAKASLTEFIYPKESPRIDEKITHLSNMLVYGDEAFSIEDFVSTACVKIKKLAQKHYNSVTTKHINTSDGDFDFRNFVSSEDTLGLFGNEDFNIEVIRGMEEFGASSSETKAFASLLSSHGSGGSEQSKTLIVVYAQKSLPAEIVKAIKNFTVVNCKKLYEGDIVLLTKTLAARSGKNFTDDALNELMDRSRMNLFQISSEIKRLAVLNHEHAEIDHEMVEETVEHFFDPNSFQATNELDFAIYRKDVKTAVAIISELIDKGFYYSLIVMRLMSIFRAMLSAHLMKDASEKFASGAAKISAEFADGMQRRKGFEKFRFSGEITAKFEAFCSALVNATGIYHSYSKYDIFNNIKNPMTLYSIHYSKNYTEEKLFELMESLYMIDVKVRTGQLRMDQRPESVKEEIYRILIAGCL